MGSNPTTRANIYYITTMKFIKYIKDCYDELLHKVSWPTWSELQNSAIVVSIASLLIAFVIYLMDISFETILEKFYTLF